MTHLSSASEIGPRSYQEDRVVAAHLSPQQGWLLAAMDGHNGHHAVDVVARSLEAVFQEELPRHAAPGEALRKTVLRCAEITQNEESGTTLSMVYVPGHAALAFVAILGDSPVLIVNERGELHISPEHNVRTNLEERKAALQRGALFEGGYLIDPATGDGLQMSRALGDRRLAHYLSRQPELYSVPLGPESLILVATDGLFDPGHTSSHSWIQEAVQDLRQGWDAQRLLVEAKRRGLLDNASAVVWKAK